MSAKGVRRREQKAATRIALRKAARQCFSERGYLSTTIGDIARAAGVAHGTLYVHFPNKDALLDELLDEFNEDLASKLQSVVLASPATPLAETVRRAAEIFLDHWEGQRGFVECYAQRSAAGLALEELRDGVNPPMAGLLRMALVAAAAQRGVVLDNPALVAQALLAMWLRVGLQFLFNDGVTRNDAVRTLVQVTTGAIDAVLAQPRIPHPEEAHE